MPTRTLRPRAAAVSKDFTRAIAYHSSAITILWILVAFLALGFIFLILVFYARLCADEQDLALLNNSLVKTQQSVLSLQDKVRTLMPKSAEAPAAVTNVAGGLTPALNASPSGLLNRGALSPDGTKYAGYDDTTKGKIGIGVETLADKRIRHIVIFNTKTESSGAQISSQQLGVRWIDNQTIEYDVMVLKSGQTAPVKETLTTKIYF